MQLDTYSLTQFSLKARGRLALTHLDVLLYPVDFLFALLERVVVNWMA